MATNPFGTTYTEAEVTYYTRGGRTTATFPATGGVYYKDGAIQIDGDDQMTIIPLNDIVAAVVLR